MIDDDGDKCGFCNHKWHGLACTQGATFIKLQPRDPECKCPSAFVEEVSGEGHG